MIPQPRAIMDILAYLSFGLSTILLIRSTYALTSYDTISQQQIISLIYHLRVCSSINFLSLLLSFVIYAAKMNMFTNILLSVPELIVIFMYADDNISKNVGMGLVLFWSLWQTISRMHLIIRPSEFHHNAFIVLCPIVTITLLLTIHDHRQRNSQTMDSKYNILSMASYILVTFPKIRTYIRQWSSRTRYYANKYKESRSE